MGDPDTKKELSLHGQEAETHCKVDHANYKIKDASPLMYGRNKKQDKVIGNGDVMVKHPCEKGTGMRISVRRSRFVMDDGLDGRYSDAVIKSVPNSSQ